MVSNENIGVALLSFAHPHQRPWSDVFATRPETTLVGVWDANHERGNIEAQRLGVKFYADIDQIIAHDSVNAVSICSENVSHAALAIAAAQAGKHILLQKPMAITVEEADRIVSSVKQTSSTFMQAYNLRFDAVHLEIKRLLDNNEIGKVHTVRRRHSHHFAIKKEDREGILDWMTDPTLAGGGALMDEGAHALLWFLWMFGKPKSVTARTGKSIVDLNVEDEVHIIFDLNNGVTGSLQTSWTEVAAGPTVEIYGDRGTILATGTDIASERSMAPGTHPLQVFHIDSGEWSSPKVELPLSRATLPPNAFIDCLAHNSPSPVPVEMAAAAVMVAQATYDSARAGKTIVL
jgi:predicted dehydrogenase